MKLKKCPYCSSEIKISKKGNEYCSNICWKKEPYKSEIEQERILMEIIHEDWGDRQ